MFLAPVAAAAVDFLPLTSITIVAMTWDFKGEDRRRKTMRRQNVKLWYSMRLCRGLGSSRRTYAVALGGKEGSFAGGGSFRQSLSKCGV